MSDEIKVTGLNNINFQASNPISPITEEYVKDLAERVKKIEDKLVEAEKGRFDLVTLLGVFVGLITYLGLEIQVFKEITNPLLIIGVSVFFITSILLFVLTINVILKKDAITWKNFWNPLHIILLVLFALSIGCIWKGYHDFFTKNNAQIIIYQNNSGGIT